MNAAKLQVSSVANPRFLLLPGHGGVPLPAVPALGRQRQADQEFKVSYETVSKLKNKTKQKTHSLVVAKSLALIPAFTEQRQANL